MFSFHSLLAALLLVLSPVHLFASHATSSRVVAPYQGVQLREVRSVTVNGKLLEEMHPTAPILNTDEARRIMTAEHLVPASDQDLRDFTRVVTKPDLGEDGITALGVSIRRPGGSFSVPSMRADGASWKLALWDSSIGYEGPAEMFLVVRNVRHH